MAASDHLHPELFHGTGHFFGEGETIDPQPNPLHGHSAGRVLDDASPAVYLTPSKSEATLYAEKAAKHKMQLFGPVYSVEPSSDITSLNDSLEKSGKQSQSLANGIYISHKPVKPKEIVGWGLNRSVTGGWQF